MSGNIEEYKYVRAGSKRKLRDWELVVDQSTEAASAKQWKFAYL